MATIYLTREEIEDVFRNVVCILLNIPDTDNKSVRFPYGSNTATGSAPGITRDIDVCYVYIIPADDGYGQQHHIFTEPYSDTSSNRLISVDEHTDIYDIRFVFYGPNSFERARSLKNGLYRDDIRKLLKTSSFFLKAGIPPLAPINEIKDGEWWWRCDVTPRFYSFVRIEKPGLVSPIDSANINIKF